MAESSNIGKSAEPTQPLPRSMRIALRVICALLPFVFLAGLEGGLRLAGFGGYPPIIHPLGPTEHGTLVMTDPAGAASYFFTNRKHAGSNQRYSFYNPKPAGTVRIVIVGESAAEGYPEPPNLASSAFLAEMLKDAWLGRKVEVLNLGTTAAASFPVLEIMTETLNYAPDLVGVERGGVERRLPVLVGRGVAVKIQAGAAPI